MSLPVPWPMKPLRSCARPVFQPWPGSLKPHPFHCELAPRFDAGRVGTMVPAASRKLCFCRASAPGAQPK